MHYKDKWKKSLVPDGDTTNKESKTAVKEQRPPICNCPFADRCMDLKQWLESEFKRDDAKRTNKQCIYFKEMEK